MFDGWRTFHSLQLSLNRRFRNGVSFGFNDTIVLYDHAIAGARVQHAADGSWSYRDDQDQANQLLASGDPTEADLQGELRMGYAGPAWKRDGAKVVGLIVNDWQLSGVWTGATAAPTPSTYGYSSGGGAVNITGSPDYAGRVRLVGDPGAGCSSDMYRQFNASAFQGPNYNSVGLESSNDYIRGCFTERARSGDRPEHPSRWSSKPAAQGGDVQRAEPAGHHRPRQLDDAGQSGGPGDDHEPAVRRGR